MFPDVIALQEPDESHLPESDVGAPPETEHIRVKAVDVVPDDGETDAVTVIGACTVTGVLTLAVIVPLTMQPGVYEPADG